MASDPRAAWHEAVREGAVGLADQHQQCSEPRITSPTPPKAIPAGVPAGVKVSEQSAPPLAPLKAGIERASFPLKGGMAVVEMPAELSQEDFEDFETWMQLVLRKAKRSVRPN